MTLIKLSQWHLRKLELFCVLRSQNKKNNNNQDADEFLIKLSKIMLAFVILSADKENFAIKFDIFMSIIYTEAVKDSI